MAHAPVTTAVTDSVIYLADLTDPTSGGVLIQLVNYGLAGLGIIVVLLGGWFAFTAWHEAKGKGNAMKEVRDVVMGVIVIEVVIGGIATIANMASDSMPF